VPGEYTPEAEEELVPSALRVLMRKGWMAVARRAAKSYLAGSDLDKAMQVSLSLAKSAIGSTICYWNADLEPPRSIVNAYFGILDRISRDRLDAYLSVKAPPLGFSRELVGEIVDRANLAGTRVHFDSLSPEATDRTFSLLEDAAARCPTLGCTLPGRWRRSVADADRAVELGLCVRVVKGQWTDPEDPQRDMGEGFLALVDRLAGRARLVAVATHDIALARCALTRLRTAGTPCELELLYGLPVSQGLSLSREMSIPTRIYVPFGHAWLPYALSQAQANPRIYWWVLRDFLLGRAFRLPNPKRLNRLREKESAGDGQTSER
jgi:proline dehydrogenase